MPSTQRFKEGDRVRNVGYFFSTGVPTDTLGTVALIRGFHGKSVHPDPSKKMVYVEWDNGTNVGVFKNELEKV